jgi:chitinase
MLKNTIYPAESSDLVDSLALPILMVQDAVKQMSSIIEQVEHMEEEKRKSIILAFLSAIFFFLPIAGQIIGTVTALANVARVIATIGVLGDVALEIQSIVEDKNNLPLAIFGIVLSPLAIMDVAKIGKAASIRRDMSPEQVGKLGERVSKPLDQISRIKGGTCKRPGASKRDLPFGAIPLELSYGASPVEMRGW